jgi:uncharacterized membrane protein YecN with MAPEG domain
MELTYSTVTLLALMPLFMFLTLYVIAYRRKMNISLGSQNDLILLGRIRMHGNFVEYTPVTLILMLLAEIRQVSVTVLLIASILLIVGRYAHAYGLSGLRWCIKTRVIGMVATFASMMILSLALAANFFA